MNRVFTTIHIEGDDEDLVRFKEQVKGLIEGEEVPFCFSSIIPIPDNIKASDNPYDWMLDNWGARWEPWDPSLEMNDKTNLTITFSCNGLFPDNVYLAMVEIFPRLHMHGTAYGSNGECAINFDGSDFTELEPPRNKTEELASTYSEEMGDENILGVTIEMDADSGSVSGILMDKNQEELNHNMIECSFIMTDEDDNEYCVWVSDTSVANDPFLDTKKLGKP